MYAGNTACKLFEYVLLRRLGIRITLPNDVVPCCPATGATKPYVTATDPLNEAAKAPFSATVAMQMPELALGTHVPVYDPATVTTTVHGRVFGFKWASRTATDTNAFGESKNTFVFNTFAVMVVANCSGTVAVYEAERLVYGTAACATSDAPGTCAVVENTREEERGEMACVRVEAGALADVMVTGMSDVKLRGTEVHTVSIAPLHTCVKYVPKGQSEHTAQLPTSESMHWNGRYWPAGVGMVMLQNTQSTCATAYGGRVVLSAEAEAKNALLARSAAKKAGDASNVVSWATVAVLALAKTWTRKKICTDEGPVALEAITETAPMLVWAAITVIKS